VFSLGMVAAFSEAAADTVSSELGQLQSRARLITNWQIVPAGTDGGVSLLGTFAGVIAALIVGILCFVMRIVTAYGAMIAISVAIVGMLADSLIGALFERRRMLKNDAV